MKEDTARCILPLPGPHGVIDWGQHTTEELRAEEIEATPYAEALFTPLPEGMNESPPYTRLRNDFVEYIYRERSIPMWVHPTLDLRSRPDESEREFKTRCRETARQRRDEELAQVERKFEGELERLRSRLEREERELGQDVADYEARKREELLSAGESVLGMFLGRRRSRALSQASRQRRLTSRAKADAEESEKVIEDLKRDIAELRDERERGLAEIRERWADVAEEVREASLLPKKSNIRVKAFGLAWVPHWVLTYEDERGVASREHMPAHPLSKS